MKNMIPFVLLLLLLLSQCSPEDVRPLFPEARGGVLDLRGWDFSLHGPVPLSGQWRFLWNREEPSFKLENFDDSAWELFRVPNYWNDTTGAAMGFGWFRLKVIVDEEKPLKLYLYLVETAYTLYINGREVLSRGTAGNSQEETVAFTTPGKVLLPSAPYYIFSWKISNFAFVEGGPIYQPVIGLAKQIDLTEWKILFFNFLIQGVMLMAAVFHLIFWFRRKGDSEHLFFALFCLSVLIRALLRSFVLGTFIPQLAVYEIDMKIGAISIFAIWVSLAFYLGQLFPRESSALINRIILFTAAFFALLILLTPSRIYTVVTVPFLIVIIASSGWFFTILIRSIRKKQRMAGVMLAAFLPFVISAGSDIFMEIHLLPLGESNLVFTGFVVFIIIQSMALSGRFADAFNTVEHLSQNLQSEVARQTRTIEDRNRQLTRMDRERTDFFINLAHETKTPLTLISFYLEKYIKEGGGPEALEIIQKNIGKLKRDMMNFLDVEKADRGDSLYKHDRIIDASCLLEELSVLFKEAARRKGISLSLDIQDKVFIQCDPRAAEGIFSNLLDNAVKYTNSGKSIEVFLSSSVEGILFGVSDKGIGMSPEQLEHVFDPFYQIYHEKRGRQGIGMGLSIVKSIVDNLGGRISIQSRRGEGSTFSVFLNSPGPHGSGADLHEQNSIEAYLPKNVIGVEDTPVRPGYSSILIVEDNLDLLEILKETLEPFYNLFLAVHGGEAINKLEDMPRPALILSDVMMDVMDGYEFYNRIAADEAYRDIPFIFLTARTGLSDRLKGLKGGAVDYIGKPFSSEELKLKIDAIIRNNRLKKVLYKKDKFTSMGVMLGGISHEIFNPLSAVKGPLQLLRQVIPAGSEDNKLVDKIFADIQANLSRIEGMIKTVRNLYFGGIEKKASLDIAVLLKPILTAFSGILAEKKIKVDLNIDNKADISGNAGSVSQIFINLISNSIEAIGDGKDGVPGGKISISTGRMGLNSHIRLSDSGPGIPLDLRDRVFYPFFTGNETGAGLGLYIVRELIEQMGWQIRIEPGEGAFFVIDIPGKSLLGADEPFKG